MLPFVCSSFISGTVVRLTYLEGFILKVIVVTKNIFISLAKLETTVAGKALSHLGLTTLCNIPHHYTFINSLTLEIVKLRRGYILKAVTDIHIIPMHLSFNERFVVFFLSPLVITAV